MYYNIRLGKHIFLKSFSISFIFKKTYLVKLHTVFDSSASSCLTMHQKILWGGSLGYKSILNFTFLTMKFSNSLHAIANLLSLLIRNLWNIHIQIWILTMVSQNLQCFKSQISNLLTLNTLPWIFYDFLKIYTNNVIRRHTFCYIYWCSDYTLKKTFLLSL